jgi:hypothetical protein
VNQGAAAGAAWGGADDGSEAPSMRFYAIAGIV